MKLPLSRVAEFISATGEFDHKSLAQAYSIDSRTLQPGEITGIIQVEQAFTIVRLNQHIPAGKAKFAAVKDVVRKELQQKKTNAVRAALDQRLHKTAKVEVL